VKSLAVETVIKTADLLKLKSETRIYNIFWRTSVKQFRKNIYRDDYLPKLSTGIKERDSRWWWFETRKIDMPCTCRMEGEFRLYDHWQLIIHPSHRDADKLLDCMAPSLKCQANVPFAIQLRHMCKYLFPSFAWLNGL
jgi:hypothetical protein